MIEEARRAGLKTSITFAPLLPFLSDDQESLDSLFERAADLEIQAIWVDALNPRPKVWQSVDALLRAHFPELRERYRRILFDSRFRDKYLEELRSRVSSSSARSSMNDRISTGF